MIEPLERLHGGGGRGEGVARQQSGERFTELDPNQ